MVAVGSHSTWGRGVAPLPTSECHSGSGSPCFLQRTCSDICNRCVTGSCEKKKSQTNKPKKGIHSTGCLNAGESQRTFIQGGDKWPHCCCASCSLMQFLRKQSAPRSPRRCLWLGLKPSNSYSYGQWGGSPAWQSAIIRGEMLAWPLIQHQDYRSSCIRFCCVLILDNLFKMSRIFSYAVVFFSFITTTLDSARIAGFYSSL